MRLVWKKSKARPVPKRSFWFGVKNQKFERNFLFLFVSLLAYPALAQTDLGGTNLSLDSIYIFLENAADYIFTFAFILVSIALVITALMYFTAGGDSTKVKKAKDMLIATLIGALIIFGLGTILATISLFATGNADLFGGGGSAGGQCIEDPFGGGEMFCSNDQNIPCTSDSDCN